MSTVSQQVGQAIFDPTREDSASAALPAYQSEPEFVFNDMSGVDMTPGEIRSIISTDFSDCQLPAESIQTLVNSSRQVQNSLRNITKEHVAIGGHLANIAHVFLSAATEQYGDNAAVRQSALGLLWSYVERVHKMRSKSQLFGAFVALPATSRCNLRIWTALVGFVARHPIGRIT